MGDEVYPRRPEDFLRLDYRAPGWEWKRNKRSFLISFFVHAVFFLGVAFPLLWHLFEDDPVSSVVRVRFYDPGEGEGGGGGGGGSGGRKPTAFIRNQPKPKPEEMPEPRRAPIAPRRIPPLRADSLIVPDLPTETSAFFDQVFSPDAQDFPGLSLEDWTDYGGLDTEPSAGSGGGIGGGEGTGQGTGTGWGVGPGEGGGFGGGKYSPGGWDIEPIPIYEPKPEYPPLAAEKLIRGEVILEILVHTDGSTEVLRVLKSLPYGCVDAAIEAAKRWRFKPALEKGKPVEAVGIITVEFDLSARKGD
jgi:TonB family protein